MAPIALHPRRGSSHFDFPPLKFLLFFLCPQGFCHLRDTACGIGLYKYLWLFLLEHSEVMIKRCSSVAVIQWGSGFLVTDTFTVKSFILTTLQGRGCWSSSHNRPHTSTQILTKYADDDVTSCGCSELSRPFLSILIMTLPDCLSACCIYLQERLSDTAQHAQMPPAKCKP